MSGLKSITCKAVTTVITSLLITSFGESAIAAPSQIEVTPTPQCSKELAFVLGEIKRHGGKNASLYHYTNDANQGYYGNPTNRVALLHIVMGGENDKTYNIMSSPVLMQSWANRLVTSCLDVAVVSFGVWYTGWSEDFAIQSNGKTIYRDCIDIEVARQLDKLPWNSTSWCEI